MVDPARVWASSIKRSASAAKLRHMGLCDDGANGRVQVRDREG